MTIPRTPDGDQTGGPADDGTRVVGRTASGEPVYGEPAYGERAVGEAVPDTAAGAEPVVRDERVIRDERTLQGDRRLGDDGELRDEVVERQREEYGGFKFGAAFFGWLAALGTGVLLTAIAAALGAVFGLGVTEEEMADAASQDAGTIGIVGAIVIAVVLFVAYLVGGYVAGRMARFDGVKQGFAVWLWAVIVAVVVAIVGWLAGSEFNVLANLNAFPRIPLNEGTLTLAGIITAVVAAAIALLAAILGGIAGARYHRRVDRVALDR